VDVTESKTRTGNGARTPAALRAEPHRSLYRKYRPQGPSEVIGQEHVIRALVGAIREGRLAHAFLFCGPRGTGKTSTARILAKMVNCERGPTPEPCGVCEQCVAIRDGQHLDVVEIDAASHGGVEDARELRERAPTAPAQGREKVYIIDEAQRLSREAFDALLKLFEEPPSGVRFVLATTEPHKMPATIIGRCQRFDFRRIAWDALAGHLAAIAEREGVSLAPEAAQTIARHAEGSARDALSLLDQASVLGDGDVDEETVLSLIGAADLEVRFALADAVAAQDPRTVFEIVHRLVQEGFDLRSVTAQVIAHFRDLFLALVAVDQADLLDVPAEHQARLAAQAAKFTPAELNRILSVLLEANTNLRWTTSPRLTLELALVKAAVPEADAHAEGLLSRIERLERLSGLKDAPPASPESPAPAPAPPPSPAPAEERVTEEPATEPHAPSTGVVDTDLVRRSWPEVLKALDTASNRVLHTVAQLVVMQTLDGDTLELVVPAGKKFAAEKIMQKQQELRAVLRDILGITPALRCVVRDGSPATDDPILEDEAPPTPELAIERVMEGLGAEIVED